MTALDERVDATLNAANVALGVILLISPWLLDFSGHQLATWNAVASGAVIAILTFAAFVRTREWEEWVDLVVGLWVIASPWLLGFAGVSSALWTHLIIGVLVTILTALELRRVHGTPPAGAA